MNNMSSSPLSKPKQAPPPYLPYPYPPYTIEEDEINLLDYWRVLIRYKVMIISITFLISFISVAVAFLMTPIYRAEVLLAPLSNREQSSMGTIASQFGGLASLAGINLGSGANDADQVLATLTSRNFIGGFIADEKLLPVLFSDEWDISRKAWSVKAQSEIPTALDAYELFDKQILDLSTDKETGLVTLAVKWRDPKQAAAWANELVSRINQHEKQLAVNEAEKSIAYLKEQLAKTSVIEMQQAIYQLLEAQTKKIMLANVREQYAFKVIDPAIVPEKIFKPNRMLIPLFAFMFGLMVSIALAFLRSRLSRLRDASI